MTPEQAVAASTLVGAAYFYAEEAQVPSDANCSYLASPMTDAVATIGELSAPIAAFSSATLSSRASGPVW